MTDRCKLAKTLQRVHEVGSVISPVYRSGDRGTEKGRPKVMQLGGWTQAVCLHNSLALLAIKVSFVLRCQLVRAGRAYRVLSSLSSHVPNFTGKETEALTGSHLDTKQVKYVPEDEEKCQGSFVLTSCTK